MPSRSATRSAAQQSSAARPHGPHPGASRRGPMPARSSAAAKRQLGEKDDAHARKAVVRAMIHRGGTVATSKGKTVRTSLNAPDRDGWVAVTPLPYLETNRKRTAPGHLPEVRTDGPPRTPRGRPGKVPRSARARDVRTPVRKSPTGRVSGLAASRYGRGSGALVREERRAWEVKREKQPAVRLFFGKPPRQRHAVHIVVSCRAHSRFAHPSHPARLRRSGFG
jgi:hypothetical protein